MPHTWKFFRAGGFEQVELESGADLACLDQLDQKLWVALACPTRGLEFDNRTLDLIDTDKDGRIRAPEVIAAAKWAAGLLKPAKRPRNVWPKRPIQSSASRRAWPAAGRNGSSKAPRWRGRCDK